MARPDFGPRWAADQGDLTEVELVHILAAAIRSSNHDAVTKLLEVQPNLHTIPMAEEGGLTATHFAARTGNRAILQTLLMDQQTFLDALCTHDPCAEHSLHIEGLKGEDDENDLYVFQPLLSYNGRAVYIGHLHGKYIYYYSDEHGEKQEYRPGWCVSPYLGSGTPHFRLLLPRARPDAAYQALEVGDGGDGSARQGGRTGARGRAGRGNRRDRATKFFGLKMPSLNNNKKVEEDAPDEQDHDSNSSDWEEAEAAPSTDVGLGMSHGVGVGGGRGVLEWLTTIGGPPPPDPLAPTSSSTIGREANLYWTFEDYQTSW